MGFPDLQGEGLNGELEFIFSLCTMSGFGCLHPLPSAAKGSLSLMMTTQCTGLGLWIVQSLVSGDPGSIGHRLSLVSWASNQTSHWLVTLTSSMPPWPQHNLQPEQIVGREVW